MNKIKVQNFEPTTSDNTPKTPNLPSEVEFETRCCQTKEVILNHSEFPRSRCPARLSLGAPSQNFRAVR